jgi:hypothetical protein
MYTYIYTYMARIHIHIKTYIPGDRHRPANRRIIRVWGGVKAAYSFYQMLRVDWREVCGSSRG